MQVIRTKIILGWFSVCALAVLFFGVIKVGAGNLRQLRGAVDDLAAQHSMLSSRLANLQTRSEADGEISPQSFEVYKRVQQSRISEVIRAHASELQSVREIPIRNTSLNAASWRYEFSLTPLALSEMMKSLAQATDLVIESYSIRRRDSEELIMDLQVTALMNLNLPRHLEVRWGHFLVRNPFDEQRRPMNAAITQAAEIPESQIGLVGLRFDGREWRALLNLGDQASPEAVATGDAIAGGVVSSVSATGVTIRYEDDRELNLRLFSGEQ